MARSGNPHPKQNNVFPKAPQGLNEKKSEGQLEASKINNILCTGRTLYYNAGILPQLVQNIKQEVQEGKNDNAIKMFGLIKENEAQNINLNGGLEVQKVFIDEATKKEAQKHIKDFIEND